MSTILGLTPDDVALAATVPKFTVGSLGEIQSSDGTKVFLYVHATEIITGAGYTCVIASDGEATMADTSSTVPGTGAGLRCGVPMAAAADNDWFWVQVYGKASVYTSANAALGTALYSTGTGGEVMSTATSGTEQITGMILGTATGGAAAVNADAYLNYPFVGVTA
jgi:hypothetical protein